LVEEYRVSVFAQELGTVEPVSPVKLDRLIRELKSGATTEQAPPERPAGPVRVAPRLVEPSAPLKSLGALDKLLKR
ncbi:MAG: DUF3418 domain-containing protein, partial [Opitutaceae bacterium]|nr:DUF3418 domain-containing protein [Opitutaceae bacterium]